MIYIVSQSIPQVKPPHSHHEHGYNHPQVGDVVAEYHPLASRFLKCRADLDGNETDVSG